MGWIRTHRLPHGAGLPARLRGPGGLYNLGNLLGLASGLALAVAAAGGPGGPSVQEGMVAAADFLTGSPAAVAITAAMLVFLVSGEAYFRAWAHGAPPDPEFNRRGDLLSGWGALGLFIGLTLVGDLVLALASGLLHAAGKFGSASRLPAALALKQRRPDPFRTIVLASRMPAIVLLVLALARASMDPLQASPAAVAGAASLLLCYLLWARADLLLYRS